MPETITKTYELISVKGVKGWIRDSWARRKILALQQAIAAIVVPTASTSNPQMDGTAAPGSSTDYARADHVHPSDTSKADALTSSQMDAVNSGVTAAFVTGKFAVVTGTLPTSATWGAYSSYPNGFTYTNCVMLSFEVYRASAGDWRQGEGSITNSFSRLYCAMDANGIRAMTNNSSTYGADYRAVLMRTDI